MVLPLESKTLTIAPNDFPYKWLTPSCTKKLLGIELFLEYDLIQLGTI